MELLGRGLVSRQSLDASLPMIEATVFVVDDDPLIRDSLSLLLETEGMTVESYDSAESFRVALDADRPGCLVLDVRLPGMGGPALRVELQRRNIHMPILFLTAHGEIPTTVGAMRAGADDFLTKPPDIAMLLKRIRMALNRSILEREQRTVRLDTNTRHGTLTPRESEVLSLAMAGHSNKHIARQLGISFRTVEVHRSNILHKMGATTLLELALSIGEQGVVVDTAETNGSSPDE